MCDVMTGLTILSGAYSYMQQSSAAQAQQDAAGRPAFVPYFMRSTERMHAEA